MLFVFDENFSKNLAAGLDLLEKSNPDSKIPVSVTSAEVLMGRRGATDSELYEAVGRLNGIVFTKDKDFKEIKLYESVIKEHRAKVLFFRSSKKLIFFWDILKATIDRWDYIKEKLDTNAPPYCYEFDIRRGISPRPFKFFMPLLLRFFRIRTLLTGIDFVFWFVLIKAVILDYIFH